MTVYRVRLTTEVSDTLVTYLEIEADDPEQAGKIALAKVNAPGEIIGWELAYAGEGTEPEIDSVDLA